MKKCRYRKNIIDYIEELLPLEERANFENHLKTCADCQKEVRETKRLSEIMDKDEVPKPDWRFFEKLRLQIPKREVDYKLPLWKIFSILGPALTIFIIILLFNLKTRQVVEFSIPISNLLEDEALNSLLLDRIIDKEIITNFETLEEYFSPTIEQDLNEMDRDELKVFMEVIRERYKLAT